MIAAFVVSVMKARTSRRGVRRALTIFAISVLSACQSSSRDRFFQTEGGAQSEQLQHLIWFFGHPDVWISIATFAIIISGIVVCLRDLWRTEQRALFTLFTLFTLFALIIGAWVVAVIVTAQYRFDAFKHGLPIETGDVALIAQLGSTVLLLLGILVIARAILRWLRGPIR